MMNGRRRALAGLAAAFLPAAPARGERMRTVGYLTGGSSGAKYLAAAMARVGWVEGRNVRYEVRRVARDAGGADAGAAALVRAAPDVLVGQGTDIVLALSRATRAIPIVCGGVSDPVGEGIAQSLQRPGANVTGLSFGLPEAAVLQVGVLRALLPRLRRLVFVTTEGDLFDRPAPAHEAAARAAGVAAELVKVDRMREMERIFATLRRGEEAAWLALPPPDAAPEGVAAAAIRQGIATHARSPREVRAGALMSYWLVHADQLARVAAIADKVLRGEDPARIPFELPDRTDFTLNRATAAALGLRVAPEILVRATEVIG